MTRQVRLADLSPIERADLEAEVTQANARRAAELPQVLAQPGWSAEPIRLPVVEASASAVSAIGEVRVVTLAEFIAVEEPGAAALVGDSEANLIPEGGLLMVYGDGGAGKTTLTIDLGLHLAAGDAWLGIAIERNARVLLVENEGPRPLFRAKLRRKLEGWCGSAIDDRISVLEEPWAKVRFDSADGREALAQVIREHEIDFVIIGPVTASGMLAAGTIQEVRSFTALVELVGELAERRVGFALIHHDNKAGGVSGAWEGAVDTLLHVSGQGHGKTRVFIQKARWSSAHHATTLQLRWAEGDSFELVDKPVLDKEQLAEQILAVVVNDPGIGWTRVEEATPEVARQTRRDVRDALLLDGKLVNVGKGDDGSDALLDHVPERRPARLYLPTDPTISHLRPDSGAAAAQVAPTGAAGGQQRLRPAPQLLEAQGVGAADAPPHDGPLPDLLGRSSATEHDQPPEVLAGSPGTWGDGNALADALLDSLPGSVEVAFRRRAPDEDLDGPTVERKSGARNESP